MKQPVRVAITGAAGQIGYQLCFRIAAGDMLGPDQPVILQLLEIPAAEQGSLTGNLHAFQEIIFILLAGFDEGGTFAQPFEFFRTGVSAGAAYATE